MQIDQVKANLKVLDEIIKLLERLPVHTDRALVAKDNAIDSLMSVRMREATVTYQDLQDAAKERQDADNVDSELGK